MAMVRLTTDDGLSVDLLIASSGIEPEVVANAETLEVVKGLLLPVARIGHLIALKLLSVAPGRETDAADLRNLAAVATESEWNLASDAVAQIQERGFARGRRLDAELATLRDTKLWRKDSHIFEGTSEIQQLVIARAISGLRVE
jgi:hypothetical protein